jgi:hypothetical protein
VSDEISTARSATSRQLPPRQGITPRISHAPEPEALPCASLPTVLTFAKDHPHAIRKPHGCIPSSQPWTAQMRCPLRPWEAWGRAQSRQNGSREAAAPLAAGKTEQHTPPHSIFARTFPLRDCVASLFRRRVHPLCLHLHHDSAIDISDALLRASSLMCLCRATQASMRHDRHGGRLSARLARAG